VVNEAQQTKNKLRCIAYTPTKIQEQESRIPYTQVVKQRVQALAQTQANMSGHSKPPAQNVFLA